MSLEVVHDTPFDSDPICGEKTVTNRYDGPWMKTVPVIVRCPCGAEDEFRIGVEGSLWYECRCGRAGYLSIDGKS